MIIKVLLYILIISIIGIEEYYWGVFHDIATYFFPVLLLVIYFVILNLEIRGQYATGQSYSTATNAGFIFSFCIGIIWGCLMSFAAGFHYSFPKSIIELLWALFNWVVIGFIFGFAGKKISGIFYNRVVQEDNRGH